MKEDFPLFVKWTEVTDWILDTVEKFPKHTRFTIANRVSNLTLDVMEEIVEAIYTRDRGDVLKRINLALEKLRVMFRISFNRRYISARQYEYVSSLLDESGRMVGGWSRSK